MDRCWLQGANGDALHAVLCAAGGQHPPVAAGHGASGTEGSFCAYGCETHHAGHSARNVIASEEHTPTSVGLVCLVNFCRGRLRGAGGGEAMSPAKSPTAKRSKPNTKRAATAKRAATPVKDAQPMRLVPSPTFDVDNLDFDRRHRPRADDLPPRPPRRHARPPAARWAMRFTMQNPAGRTASASRTCACAGCGWSSWGLRLGASCRSLRVMASWW